MLLFQLIKLLLSDPLQFLIAIAVLFIPLLISITVHEWAHGFVAYKFGDNTPKIQGRLSLNPFSHLDPLGTLMLFIIGIGWAKPVEINPMNISHNYKKLKLMFVAFAGPLSNFILGTIFSVLMYLLLKFSVINSILMLFMFSLLIRINFVLGIFNLLPIPPLDGSNIIANLLPDNLANQYYKLAPYSIFILLVLIFTGGIGFIFDLAEIIQSMLFKIIESFFEYYA